MMNKLKSIILALACLAILGVSRGLLGQQPAGTLKGRAPTDPASTALIKERMATARDIFKDEINRYQHGVFVPTEETPVWSRRWMEEELRLDPSPAEKLAAIRDHLERAKVLEQIARGYAETGQGRLVDAEKAKYFRLEAEQLLAEARAAHPGVPVPSPKPVLEHPVSAPQPAPAPAPPR